MTQNDNGPGPGSNYREDPDFTFDQKVFLAKKSVFIPKKHPKFAKGLIFIWEKGTFFFAQLCLDVARTRFELRSAHFFIGHKTSDLGPKIRFLL